MTEMHDTTHFSTITTEIVMPGQSKSSNPVSPLHTSVSEVNLGTQKNVDGAVHNLPRVV